ncbi:MAG: ATP-binding protein [Variovorax sp.]
MNETAATTAAPTGKAARPTHPIVELDYRVRTWANVLMLIVLSSICLERDPPPWVWALVVFQGLVWAHVAHALARRATDSRDAEHKNLMVDALLYGVLSGLVSYELWPSTLMLTSVLLSILSLGGAKLAAKGFVAWISGQLLGGAANGFDVAFASSLRTSLLSVACFVPYLLMFGVNAYAQTQRAQRARREVSARNRQITLQNHQLELARMLAETANRTKGAFLANMSHELRTPLNAIIGYSELMQADAEDLGDQERIDDLQKIRAAGVQLLAMVEDVLNLSKAEAGQMNLVNAPFRPDVLVHDIADTMRDHITRSGNAFRVSCEVPPLALLGDAEKIRQILGHLLSNAGKFTRDGEVVLTVRHEAETQFLVMQVDDTGIGIAAAQREQLFRAFAQADSSSTRRFGGSGLGLAITHHYCELMGGTIEVQSEPGRGAHFTARIPAPVAAVKRTEEVAHA